MNTRIDHELIEPADFEATWIVNLAPNANGNKRVKVQAYSEESAILAAEERFDVVAISARLA